MPSHCSLYVNPLHRVHTSCLLHALAKARAPHTARTSISMHTTPTTMLTYIHHPAGPVVIRTTHPSIALCYQKRGWLTTSSFAQVLRDHPEWQSTPILPTSITSTPSTEPQERIFARIASTVISSLSATIAIVPSYAPTGVRSIAPLFVGEVGHDVNREKREGFINNGEPIHWMTAVERTWYRDHGLPVPTTGWLKCSRRCEAIEHILESGELDIDVSPPGYEAAISIR